MISTKMIVVVKPPSSSTRRLPCHVIVNDTGRLIPEVRGHMKTHRGRVYRGHIVYLSGVGVGRSSYLSKEYLPASTR